jgi:uroporphyrinogen decarboxylase
MLSDPKGNSMNHRDRIRLAVHYREADPVPFDLEGQAGLLISRRICRKYIKPADRRICKTIRKYTDAVICLHSCGSVGNVIPDLIETGFNVLNPVQSGAPKGDPVELKRESGRDLAFWGGGSDSQTTPPFAPPEEVELQAHKSLEAFADGGGYIYPPINMINAVVPPKNINARAEMLRDFSSY